MSIKNTFTSLENEIWNRSIGSLLITDSDGYKNMTIHFWDCFSRGSISPIEAIDALTFRDETKYYPSWVSCRKSNYDKLI